MLTPSTVRKCHDWYVVRIEGGDLAKVIKRSLMQANLVGITILALWSLLPPRLSEPVVPYGLLLVGNVALIVVWTTVVNLVLAPRLVRRVLAPAAGFLDENRPPTEDEVQALVAQPWRQGAWNIIWWPGALFWEILLNAGLFYRPGEWPLIRFSVAIMLSGYISSAFGVVLVERRMRPVFAQAFADVMVPTRKSQSVRAQLLLLWSIVAAEPMLAIVDVISGLNANQMVQIRGAIQQLVVLSLIAGGIATWFGARSIIEPLADVAASMRRIGAGDLDADVTADRPGELGALQTGFNHMVSELRQRRMLEALFRRHVGSAVAEQALASGRGHTAERCDASLVFVRFHRAEPDRFDAETVALINDALETIVAATADAGGWVNKLSESGAMCVFGPLTEDRDHADAALGVARRVGPDLAARHDPAFLRCAIGVATGLVVAGHVGASNRHEFTVIGEAANAAARLAELAADREPGVLASGYSIEAARREGSTWVALGDLVLRGWPAPTSVYAPLDVDRASTGAAPGVLA